MLSPILGGDTTGVWRFCVDEVAGSVITGAVTAAGVFVASVLVTEPTTDGATTTLSPGDFAGGVCLTTTIWVLSTTGTGTVARIGSVLDVVVSCALAGEARATTTEIDMKHETAKRRVNVVLDVSMNLFFLCGTGWCSEFPSHCPCGR